MGFDVIRAKIEATASIDGVPVTDAQAVILPKKTYFEFHVSLTSLHFLSQILDGFCFG